MVEELRPREVEEVGAKGVRPGVEVDKVQVGPIVEDLCVVVNRVGPIVDERPMEVEERIFVDVVLVSETKANRFTKPSLLIRTN